LGYARGQYALTPITHASDADGRQRLVIGPAHGRYPGQPKARAYELRLHATARPAAIPVDDRQADGWSWDERNSTVVLRVPRRSVRDTLTVRW
jgi:hypothetical protein